MKVSDVLESMPETDRGVVVIISGGMDSTITTRLAVEKYGKDKVSALTFDYGQRQKIEVERAKTVCARMEVDHRVYELPFFPDLSKGICANVDRDVQMPTIQEVLGDPEPKTVVPFRNMILLTIASALAEQKKREFVFYGAQVHDSYYYWDTTQEFVAKMNAVIVENRKHNIKIVAPFAHIDKSDEIRLLMQLNDLDLLEDTLTCYDPNEKHESCGRCPGCSDRIMNFAKAGVADKIPYSREIPWDDLIAQHKRDD